MAANSLFSGALAGLPGFLGLGGPADTPPPNRPVSAPVVASAATGVRGTIVMIHGGGWADPTQSTSNGWRASRGTSW